MIQTTPLTPAQRARDQSCVCRAGQLPLAARAVMAAAITLALGGTLILDAMAADPPDMAAPSKTVQLLQKLLTFDTSNPPGNTKALAEFLKTN